MNNSMAVLRAIQQTLRSPLTLKAPTMIITLGKSYRDRITGVIGTATGYVQYLSGCNQALISPKALPGDAIVLDNTATPGCDRAAPKR